MKNIYDYSKTEIFFLQEKKSDCVKLLYLKPVSFYLNINGLIQKYNREEITLMLQHSDFIILQ